MDRCDECGFDYQAIPPAGAAAAIGADAAETAALLRTGDVDLRRRRAPERWSPLEYGCHVRDLLLVQRERVLLARRRDTPSLEPMGRDERATHDGYAEQDPGAVAAQVVMAAKLFADDLGRMGPDDWNRTLLYNYPERAERTLGWVAVHTLHEVHHHLLDIRRLLPESTGVAAGAVTEDSDGARARAMLRDEEPDDAIRARARRWAEGEIAARNRARDGESRSDDVRRLCLAMLAGDLPLDRPDAETGMVPVGVARVGQVAIAEVAWFGPDHDHTRQMTYVRNSTGGGARWRELSGGGGGRAGATGSVADRLAAWSRRPPAAEWNGDLVRVPRWGGFSKLPRGVSRPGRSYVAFAMVRAAAEADHIEVGGRSREIPWHGRVLVCWLTHGRIRRDDRHGGFTIMPKIALPPIVAVSTTGARFRLRADPKHPGHRS